MSEDSKKLVLYLGRDLSELQVANKLIPELVRMGVEPVIAVVSKRDYQNPDSETPAMKELSFWHSDILQDAVLPFMDSQDPYLDAEDKLRGDICYTPRQLAKHFELELHEDVEVNSATHQKQISKDKSIIGAISLRCTHILQQPIIDIYQKKGFLWNAHPGKLPSIRGVLPVYRALERGEPSIEWTLHSIVDNTVDTGPIHSVTSQAADFRSGSVFMHYNENAQGVSAMVLGTLKDVLENRAIRKMAQLRRAGTQYTFPNVDATNAFTKAGGAMVEPKHQMAKYYGKIFAGKGSPMRKGLDYVVDCAVRERCEKTRSRLLQANDTRPSKPSLLSGRQPGKYEGRREIGFAGTHPAFRFAKG